MRNSPVEVIPLVPLSPKGNQKFSYAVPAGFSVAPGALVTIPFANRFVEGIVYENSPKTTGPIKEISRVINKQIISRRDFGWLEAWADFSFESLSLLAKTLVASRKSLSATVFPDGKAKKNKFKTAIKFSENSLEKIIRQNYAGQLLILIPETVFNAKISAVCEKLGQKFYFFNNRLSLTEKTAVLDALASNQPCAVIATHGGIFLPFKNLSAIVLFEPALSTHRQWNMRPKYDSRTGAYFRAKADQIPLYFISTLPSFELIALAEKGGALFNNDKIFVMEKKWDEPRLFSPEIINLLRRQLDEGKKIIIYHDAVGYESLYACGDCGNILRCDTCANILQKQGANLFCKACKTTAGALRAFCDKCGSPKIRALKTGTKAIESSLKREFSAKNILRVDREIKNGLDIKQAVASADIVVATQKIFSFVDGAPFDFCLIPDFSTLIGATNFLSLENALIALQRLKNIIKPSPAKTIYLQNSGAESALLRSFKNNQTSQIIEEDLADRKQLFFPPFSRLVTLEKTFKSEKLANKEVIILADKIKIDPLSAKINTFVFKRRNKITAQIILRDQGNALKNYLAPVPGTWLIDAPVPLGFLLTPAGQK